MKRIFIAILILAFSAQASAVTEYERSYVRQSVVKGLISSTKDAGASAGDCQVNCARPSAAYTKPIASLGMHALPSGYSVRKKDCP